MNANVTKDRQKKFMIRTLVGMVLYNKRELTDEECAIYNSIRALIESSGKQESPDEMKDYYDFSNGRRGPVVVDRPDKMIAKPAPPAEASCPHCGGSGYARGGEEEQIKCRACSGSGIVLRQPAPPTVKQDLTSAPTDEERIEELRRSLLKWKDRCHTWDVWDERDYDDLLSILNKYEKLKIESIGEQACPPPPLIPIKIRLGKNGPEGTIKVSQELADDIAASAPPAKEKKRPYVDEGQFYDTPEQEALTEERREMANRLRRAVKNSHYADTHLSEDGLGRMGADVMAGADENYRLDLEAIDALLLAPSPPAGEPEKIDTQDLLDKGILLTRRPAAPVRVSRVRAGGTEIGVVSIIRDDEVAVVFFRLMESGTPGQSVPRMEVGKTLPDDRILFEIVIPKPEFCMAFINGFCEAWRMLQDREKGVIVEDGEKP